MTKTRLEAFSDAVIAIIITIMVLELRPPHEADWHGLQTMLPTFLIYTLSYVFLGIYWNNHHHMLHAADRISGRVLWPNLHLLFWLSLVPFVTAWMGETKAAPLPTAAYGFVLLMSAFAYVILQSRLVAYQGPHSRLKDALGSDLKGKISLTLYVVSVLVAFLSPYVSLAIYVLVAMVWLVPDKRIESRMEHAGH
jgi:uncharacterized membrane protein